MPYVMLCPSHDKNSIPHFQFLRLRPFCSDDSDFSFKSEEIYDFFDKRGYSASVVQAGHHRAQQIDRHTFHPHNHHAVKSIILKNFKLIQNDPDTGRIFSQPPLISFKRDKNVGKFLVRSAKHVLSFTTLRKYRDPNDPPRSLIILPVPQPMSSTA